MKRNNRVVITFPEKIQKAWEKGMITIGEAKKETVKNYLIESMDYYEQKKARELAERVLNVSDPYEIADSGETVESTMETIRKEPEYIIEFLLDIIENLTA